MTYVSKRTPREWQAKCLPILWRQRAFAVLAGMRTGKTKVIVDDWGRMVHEGLALDLLVIAPGGAYLPWEGALYADLPEKITKRLQIFVWSSRTARTKLVEKQRDMFMRHRGPRVLLINIEALGLVKAARQFVYDFVSQNAKLCEVVVDESVGIKNVDSNAGFFVAERLGAVGNLSGWRRIVSGLISPRAPSDTFNQFRFLDPSILGIDDLSVFRARYELTKQVCMIANPQLRGKLRGMLNLDRTPPLTPEEIRAKATKINPNLNVQATSAPRLLSYLQDQADGMPRDMMIQAIQRLGGYVQTVPVLEGYQNTEELADRIAPYSYRVRLEDCYDMPASDYSIRDVEMTPVQLKVYRDLKTQAFAELESLDYVTATHVVTRMLRLHQVLCGHVTDEKGEIHDLAERRTTELINLLRDYDGKAIIWCSYDRTIQKVFDAVEKEFGAGSTSRFWGGNVRTREQEEVEFKTNPRRRFNIATPDAGGMGRDWSVADLCVYFSSRNNLHHRDQSEQRTKAVGKMRPVAYVDLLCRGTVEEPILDCLRRKIDMAAVINGDEWRKWVV